MSHEHNSNQNIQIYPNLPSGEMREKQNGWGCVKKREGEKYNCLLYFRSPCTRSPCPTPPCKSQCAASGNSKQADSQCRLLQWFASYISLLQPSSWLAEEGSFGGVLRELQCCAEEGKLHSRSGTLQVETRAFTAPLRTALTSLDTALAHSHSHTPYCTAPQCTALQAQVFAPHCCV